jgi:hypothetical protein
MDAGAAARAAERFKKNRLITWLTLVIVVAGGVAMVSVIMRRQIDYLSTSQDLDFVADYKFANRHIGIALRAPRSGLLGSKVRYYVIVARDKQGRLLWTLWEGFGGYPDLPEKPKFVSADGERVTYDLPDGEGRKTFLIGGIGRPAAWGEGNGDGRETRTDASSQMEESSSIDFRRAQGVIDRWRLQTSVDGLQSIVLSEWSRELRAAKNEDTPHIAVSRRARLYDCVHRVAAPRRGLGHAELTGAYKGLSFFLSHCDVALPPELNEVAIEVYELTTVEGKTTSAWAREAFETIVARLPIRYANAYADDEYRAKNMIDDETGVRAIGANITDAIPGLYWLTFSDVRTLT